VVGGGGGLVGGGRRQADRRQCGGYAITAPWNFCFFPPVAVRACCVLLLCDEPRLVNVPAQEVFGPQLMDRGAMYGFLSKLHFSEAKKTWIFGSLQLWLLVHYYIVIFRTFHLNLN